MKLIKITVLGLCVMLIGACQAPERRAYRAQSKIHEERLKLVDEYKKCLKQAGEDKAKVELCDSYLKAAESLK